MGSYIPPSQPSDTSIKTLQYGYSVTADGDKIHKFWGAPVPYYNQQIANPNNDVKAKVQAFIDGHTDQDHLKQYAMKGGKWLVQNFLNKKE
ncbi:hypothetical protein PACTADRAFT_48523 [Pachysolen tannophilus NRRL Y-2460]|uniref:Uncharacterized protein n=1 Tax=Pachysolen tannophilus NRRL Y-2460 TaxID=669874 RepID=A0A1E4TY62_PACTA|nr:hypothetical protein PACTADRAFT_48523 [Pachysolen tannophilus NRRL Y-2460]